jgi:hypothetical protein
LENTLPKVVDGPKVHLKKEAGLENTLPKVVDGPKAHLKREAGLENTLPKRWLMALGRTKKGR